MDAQTGCFVSGVLAVVLRLSRYAGVAPLHFVKKNNGWHISLSTGWSLYGYIIFTITILLSTGIVMDNMIGNVGQDVLLETLKRRVMWFVTLCQTLILAGITIYGAPKLMRSVIASLNLVQKIHFDLDIPQWPMKLERKIGLLIGLWVIVAMFLVGSNCMVLLSSLDGQSKPASAMVFAKRAEQQQD